MYNSIGLDTATTVLLLVPPILGIIGAIYEMLWVFSIKINGSFASDGIYLESARDVAKTIETMKTIAKSISEGANAFLMKEYFFMSFFIVAFSIILYFLVGLGTMISFIVGCITSILSGYIGMQVAVRTNVRTSHETWKDLKSGFSVALRGGSVMGFALVSLGIVNLFILIIIYRMESFYGTDEEAQTHLFESIAGYGLGGSSIALFARVGGGIYTKAADVGADLVGKIEHKLEEDDPRNPASIADNVGDNVGDVAGMGADLFGSLAESTCAALVIAGSSVGAMGLANSWSSLMYPVTISSTGIITGLITIYIVKLFYKVNTYADISKALKATLYISTLIETPVIALISFIFLPPVFTLATGATIQGSPDIISTNWYSAMICVFTGLYSGLAIGYITEYYTSHSFSPVRQISISQKTSAATGIIHGLALGYMSTIIPIVCLAISVCISHLLCGMYGIALAALGILSTLTMSLTIDGYGPISDNAGGIVEMAKLGDSVREKTDALDAAGNTTAAIGKGFAIGSAALVSLALFGAYTVRAKISVVDILDPWTFTGLLFGAMIPYAFFALTMRSVGIAALQMAEECNKQIPSIVDGSASPDYKKCISISTTASLKEMILPGALVILSPLLAGGAFGKNCTAGLLTGSLVSGIQLAISASNSGGAWDNSKKYIESGGLGPDHEKRSTTHKNAVIGDTVGDPMKDTSGPSLNILVKLSAITSLVFASYIAETLSNATGGPWWWREAA